MGDKKGKEGKVTGDLPYDFGDLEMTRLPCCSNASKM